LGQQEEGRLEGIFGVLDLRQDPTAHPKDQRSVAAHDLPERRFVARPAEALEQFPVRCRTDAGMLQECANLAK
jgi:hypothetical protein